MKIELAGQAPERVATLGHVLPAVFAFTQESTPLKVRSQETWHIITIRHRLHMDTNMLRVHTQTHRQTQNTHMSFREKNQQMRKKEKQIPSGYLTVCHGKIHHFQQVNPGKPSISMGHLWHGYVKSPAPQTLGGPDQLPLVVGSDGHGFHHVRHWFGSWDVTIIGCWFIQCGAPKIAKLVYKPQGL